MSKFSFHSRRSPIISLHGSAASTNPLVSEIGARILQAGGNAADAAVAMAACLNVTQPCSTGIGGDCFCLFYDARSNTVKGLNGSGRSSAEFTLAMLASHGITAEIGMPPLSAHTITVPGAAAGWVDVVESFGSGKLSLKDILNPAITLAEEGFPVSPVVSHLWAQRLTKAFTSKKNPDGTDFLLDGRAPRPGEIMKMPRLAETFRMLSQFGKDGFYQGRIARAIVDIVQRNGGTLTTEDLQKHTSTFCEPLSTTYHGIRVWEIPPNSQGITALLALNILEKFPVSDLVHNSIQYMHLVIEALRLSFADTFKYCADPEHTDIPVQKLLSKGYAGERLQLISKERYAVIPSAGVPIHDSDTVYFAVTDCDGNACSFINSNFQGFGTGLVPVGCGFTLQNRGLNFSLIPGHLNCAAPGKRPYHTIIPGMATYDQTGELYASFGVMGAFMQPQGHVQVLLNMINFNMDPQEALDQPRFKVELTNNDKVVGNKIFLEQGISEEVGDGLRGLGYNVECGKTFENFGRGQIIQQKLFTVEGERRRVYWAGSDPRGDGMAVGF